MIGRLFDTRVVVCLSLALVIWLPQVLTETSAEEHHTIDKRNIGVLARTGQLPYRPGKRYVASLARSGNLPVYLEKKLHPGMTNRNQLPQDSQIDEPNEKRYVGTLARTGNLPFQFLANKRDPQGVQDEEDIDRLRALEAETKALETVLFLESQLNLELLKEKLLDGAVPSEEDPDEEKRSLASLARTGGLPLRHPDDKRSVEALARAGHLPATMKTLLARHEGDAGEEEKRSVAALAKNGVLRGGEGKRGGIGALARNNLLPQKKDGDVAELEGLIEELIEREEEKRNIGSLARGFGLPSAGKRNLAALAKGGGYSRYAKSDDDDHTGEKRNLASLVRGRQRESKRYLGSLARSQSLPSYRNPEEKRTSPLMSGKSWNQRYYGKRYPYDIDDEETSVGEVAKRYVAALLRHGRLPVGSEEHAETEVAEDEAREADDKRHIGSLRGSSSSVSKRSIENQTTDTHGKVVGGRSKRQAGGWQPSDDYAVANAQNAEMMDYDDLMELMSGSAAPEKRFLGSVARGGWFREPSSGGGGGRGRRGGGGGGGGGGLDMGKRHIGALARLGWLPQLRSSRYRRFGRAIPSRGCKRSLGLNRSYSADGRPTSQDHAGAVRATPPRLARRRYLSDAEARAGGEGDAADVAVADGPTVRPLRFRNNNYYMLRPVDRFILRKLFPAQFEPSY